MYEDVINNGLEYLKELFREYLPELVEDTKEQIRKALPKIKKEMVPTIKKFVRDLLKSQSTSASVVETLTLQELIKIAKKNIVEGANGFAALKTEKNKKVFVYLANCKDSELLDESINKYVIIQANTLSKEVEDLFGDTDLIILQ